MIYGGGGVEVDGHVGVVAWVRVSVRHHQHLAHTQNTSQTHPKHPPNTHSPRQVQSSSTSTPSSWMHVPMKCNVWVTL